MIRVTVQSSNQGGCNTCHRSKGDTPEVFVLDAGGDDIYTALRFCPPCYNDLVLAVATADRRSVFRPIATPVLVGALVDEEEYVPDYERELGGEGGYA